MCQKLIKVLFYFKFNISNIVCRSFGIFDQYACLGVVKALLLLLVDKSQVPAGELRNLVRCRNVKINCA